MALSSSSLITFAWKAKRFACTCRFSLSSSFPRLLRNIGEFGAKNILQTITYLIQYVLLEIQFRSVRCMAVTIGYTKNLRYIPSPLKRCKRLQSVDESKSLQKGLNVFSTTYTYSNYILYWLLCCWQIT